MSASSSSSLTRNAPLIDLRSIVSTVTPRCRSSYHRGHSVLSGSPHGGSLLIARAPAATARATAAGPGTLSAMLTMRKHPLVENAGEIEIRRDQAAVPVPFEYAHRCRRREVRHQLRLFDRRHQRV